MPARGSAIGIPFSKATGNPLLFKFNAPSNPVGTFTRASNASYRNSGGTMVYAGNDSPRSGHIEFDPTTGVFKFGTLLETQSTNGVQYSNNLVSISQGGVWNEQTAICQSLGATAPDNTSAFTLSSTGTGNVGIFIANVLTYTPSTGYYSTSVFFQLIDAVQVFIRNLDGALCVFNLGTATVDINPPGVSCNIEQWGSWFRCSVSGAVPAGVDIYTYFGIYNSTGADSVNVWAPQNEQQQSPSSYIPTVDSSPVTRAPDQWVIPISFKPQELTIYMRVIRKGLNSGRMLLIGNSFVNCLLIDDVTYPRAYFDNSGTPSYTNPFAMPPVFGVSHEILVNLSAAGAPSITGSINGAASISGGSGGAIGLPANWGANQLYIGYFDTPFFGVVRDVMIFKGTRNLAYCRLKVSS